MANKYSLIVCTLATDDLDILETPREHLEPIAKAGYDGVDVDAEPDKIPVETFNEIRNIADSLGLKIPAFICARCAWYAGEEHRLASRDESRRQHPVQDTKKCIDLAAAFDDLPML